MPITTTCSCCEAKFTLPDKLAGKRVRCPRCGQVFVVPAARLEPHRPNAGLNPVAAYAAVLLLVAFMILGVAWSWAWAFGVVAFLACDVAVLYVLLARDAPRPRPRARHPGGQTTRQPPGAVRPPSPPLAPLSAVPAPRPPEKAETGIQARRDEDRPAPPVPASRVGSPPLTPSPHGPEAKAEVTPHQPAPPITPHPVVAPATPPDALPPAAPSKAKLSPAAPPESKSPPPRTEPAPTPPSFQPRPPSPPPVAPSPAQEVPAPPVSPSAPNPVADRRAKKEEKRKAKRQKLQEKRAAEEEQLCEMGLWFLFKNTMLDKDKDAGGWTPRPQASNGYRVVPLDLHKYPVRLAVEKFIEAHNRCVHQGPAGEVGIDVVHGYSTEYRSHCIKNAIRRLCGLYSEKMHFMPGEAYDRNGGHTLVVPVGLLPYLTDQLFDRLVGDWPPGPDR